MNKLQLTGMILLGVVVFMGVLYLNGLVADYIFNAIAGGS